MPETGLQEEALFILADIIMSVLRFLELLQPSGYGLELKCGCAEMGRLSGLSQQCPTKAPMLCPFHSLAGLSTSQLLS